MSDEIRHERFQWGEDEVKIKLAPAAAAQVNAERKRLGLEPLETTTRLPQVKDNAAATVLAMRDKRRR